MSYLIALKLNNQILRYIKFCCSILSNFFRKFKCYSQFIPFLFITVDLFMVCITVCTTEKPFKFGVCMAMYVINLQEWEVLDSNHGRISLDSLSISWLIWAIWTPFIFAKGLEQSIQLNQWNPCQCNKWISFLYGFMTEDIVTETYC